MNEFKTDVQGTKGIYTIEYRTNSRANYEEAQELIRKFVDNKPKTNFDRITESVESLAVVLVDLTEEELEPNLLTYLDPINMCSTSDKGLAIRNTIEWLQKECENG